MVFIKHSSLLYWYSQWKCVPWLFSSIWSVGSGVPRISSVSLSKGFAMKLLRPCSGQVMVRGSQGRDDIIMADLLIYFLFFMDDIKENELQWWQIQTIIFLLVRWGVQHVDMSPGDRLRSPAGYFPSQIYSKNIKKFKRKFRSEKNKLFSIRICLTILRICRRSSWSGLDALPGEKSEHLGPRKKPLVIIRFNSIPLDSKCPNYMN